jgi:predicted type IV restriction endonuclease
MIEDLMGLINNLKNNSRLSSYSEDQTKMAIIQPILRRLGWDTENVDEVCPEFSVEKGNKDGVKGNKDGVKAKLYTLQKDGKNIRNGR